MLIFEKTRDIMGLIYFEVKNMAKKKRTTTTTTTSSTHSLIRLLAFIGIFLSALLFVVGAILNWCGLGNITSILNLIAQLSLLVAVAFPAWEYVKYRRKVWKVVYWVALAIYVFGVVFGVIGIYIVAK